MQGVLSTVEASARQAGAKRVITIRLVIGEMTEIISDAMEFAFEALCPNTICEGARLTIQRTPTRSRCCVCNAEFVHDRYRWACPECDSLATELLSGREMYIDSIEIEEDIEEIEDDIDSISIDSTDIGSISIGSISIDSTDIGSISIDSTDIDSIETER